VAAPFDALLLATFGGPERPEDVRPFLERLAGHKGIPPGRLDDAASKYEQLGGVSPINSESRALLCAMVEALRSEGLDLALYWGNLYAHPLLDDAVEQMAEDGVRRALVFVPSAFASYQGCRAYREYLDGCRQAVGTQAPEFEKLRLFYNHPGFVEAAADRLRGTLEQLGADRRAAARLVFTAHSLPRLAAERCPYESQLREACRLVAERAGCEQWDLAYQSRPAMARQEWLEPEIGAHLIELARTGQADGVVLMPIGFVCEHMEVVYDLDVELGALCEHLGLEMVRVPTIGCHPRFVEMIAELAAERVEPGRERRALGEHGPWPDECPADCCGAK